MELGYGLEMFVLDVIGSIFNGKRHKIERMDYAV